MNKKTIIIVLFFLISFVLLAFSLYLWDDISGKCISSGCGKEGICSTDCGGNRSYLLPQIFFILSIFFGILGIFTRKRK